MCSRIQDPNYWDDWEASSILNHINCNDCVVAREFIINALINSARMNNSVYSNWLLNKYSWGEVNWPLYWCKIPFLSELDCGAFSAIVREYMICIGLRCYPVQFILKYHELSIGNWLNTWKNTNWINEKYVYHELVGFDKDNRFVFWDTTENIEFNLVDNDIPDQLVKFRILSSNREFDKNKSFVLGNGRIVNSNIWIDC